ncbi:MAG: DUF5722 domain-containing protein [Verrucomicrobiales bacterium]|nr:DUF5722 domain-containing protein [Verrucomicrobiales bacterium]
MIRVFIVLLIAMPAFILGGTPLLPGPHRDVRITRQKNGAATIEITGATAHFWSQPVTVPKENTVLSFEYFSPSGIKSLSVRYRNSDETMSFAGSKPVPLAETWQPFSLELSGLPDAKNRFHFAVNDRNGSSLQIRNFQLRTPNPEELREKQIREERAAQRLQEAEKIKQYLRTDFKSKIDKVIVEKQTIRISGSTDRPVRLVELPLHIPSQGKSTLPPLRLAKGGEFSFEVQRFVAGRDRAVSRWRLDDLENNISSHAKWPTHYIPEVGNQELKPERSTGKKGIGGVPAIMSPDHMIFELGVKHATINVILDGLLYRQKKPGLKPWDFEGRTYYINKNFLATKDATIRNLAKNNVIITCILLIRNAPNAELKHPEAEARGIYSMPNLTREVTAHHYRAALHFLAERYSQPDARISNWVIHNEIDQAGTWTNMGDQPLARYLETYARSARAVYHTTRLHDPHTRVFVSLTHHWAKQSSGHGTYQVKQLVDLWRQMATAEGPFGWGIAYHPYPQNLRNPDTWDDKDVTYDFTTPYITPKNIEVLPAYLGPDVPILLSEQGFNTPTLSVENQKRQAAGLVYMFRKLKELPSIEAYHLHRYQDLPENEGGLRLGILDENGNKKLGWHTYVAIETADEEKVYTEADKLLPPAVPVRVIPSPRDTKKDTVR